MKLLRVKLTQLVALWGLMLMAAPAGALEMMAGDWKPYVDTTQPEFGLLGKVVKAALASQGEQVVFKDAPWKRVEVMLNEGKTASFGYRHTVDRAKRWTYSDAFFNTHSILIGVKGKPIKWTGSLSDLKNYKIGITRGYSYGEDFEKMKPQLNLENANKDVHNLNKVFMGRIDAFAVAEDVGIQLIRDTYPNRKDQEQFVFYREPPLSSSDLHVVCAPKASAFDCPALIVKFNKGIAAIRDNGRLAQILSEARSLAGK